MVLLDLFPAGIYQFKTVTDHGLWFARSSTFIDGTAFQTLTWLRIIGGALFTLGGVVPLTWFIMSRRRKLKGKTSYVSELQLIKEEKIAASIS